MDTIDPNLLDVEIVTTFVEMGSEVLGDLVELYVENARQDIRKLLESAQAGSLEEVKKAAHSLKGSSLNTGASAMGRLCLEIEKSARENDREAALNQITSLPDLLEKTHQAFLSIRL